MMDKRVSHAAVLFRFELRLFARARITWIVFTVLFAAMTWGAVNGQQHAEEQQTTIERVRLREVTAIAEHKAAVARYSQPAPARLPYWQDPSDVAGYMRYGLVAFAVKPPSPLGALAVGQSKVLPFYLRAELDYIAPPDAAFDFVNPRILSLGDFDLAFVLVYLVPLALIALGASRLSAERDSGALRLLAAHTPSPRHLVMLKFGAMVAVSVPLVLLEAGLALAVAGTPLWCMPVAKLLPIIALAIAAYAVFWSGLTAVVASRMGVVASSMLLLSLWMISTFFIPAANALVLEVSHPAPSRLQYLDDLRRESNLTPAQRDAVFNTYLAAQPAYAAAAGRIEKIPYATKQIAVQIELERHLLPSTSAMATARADAGRSADMLRRLSPTLVLDSVLQAVAGTDAVRHEAFLRRTRAYTEDLRAFFWPRALKEAASPSTSCEKCAGRLNFIDHDKIPRYVADSPLEGVAARTANGMLYLWLLAAATVFLLWRTRDFRL